MVDTTYSPCKVNFHERTGKSFELQCHETQFAGLAVDGVPHGMQSPPQMDDISLNSFPIFRVPSAKSPTSYGPYPRVLGRPNHTIVTSKTFSESKLN